MEFVRKLPRDGSDGFYIVNFEWQENNCSLVVIDNELAWTGKLCPTDVESACTNLETSLNDYFIELRDALTCNADRFCFRIENHAFLVKKRIENDIRIQFSSIPLEQHSTIQAYKSMLSSLIDKFQAYETQKKNLDAEVVDLRSEREDLISKLEMFANEKLSLETILYSKFLNVLNAKKERLVEMALAEQALTASSEDPKSQPENTSLPTKSPEQVPALRKRKYVFETSSEKAQSASTTSDAPPEKEEPQQSDHYDSDTEEETDDEIEVAKAPNLDMPSTSYAAVTDSDRELPLRGTSSRVKHEPAPAIPITSENRFSDSDEEFNSQSVLSDFLC